jgi:alkyl hydroperoxide reductase subunit AhpC
MLQLTIRCQWSIKAELHLLLPTLFNTHSTFIEQVIKEIGVILDHRAQAIRAVKVIRDSRVAKVMRAVRDTLAVKARAILVAKVIRAILAAEATQAVKATWAILDHRAT